MRLLALWLSWSIALPSTAGAADSARSVYELTPEADAPVALVAALGIALPYANARNLIHPRCPCDPGEVNRLDRGAIGNSNAFLDSASDATAGAAVLLPVILDGLDLGWSSELREDVAVFSESLLINGALDTAAKYLTQRPLPRTYANDPSLLREPGGYRSFYSGHTSLVFAALSTTAVTLDLRYHAGAWPWIVAGGVGAMVAVERVAAGRHFPTDVAVGALAGAAIGTAVPLLHRRDAGSGGSGQSSLALLPTPGGVALTWTRLY